MGRLSLPQQQALEQERQDLLQQLENWLDLPMLILSIVWLVLFVIELTWGLTPLLDALGITIWIIFILEFALEIFLAPRKLAYLRQNWLGAVSLVLPALRIFRFARIFNLYRSVRAVRGMQLLRVMTRTNRGMRALSESFTRRGFGYVLAATAAVTLVGAAGMYAFEQDALDSGLPDYGAALWWTAMLMTTIGSEYFPRSPEGRILCFFLALYASAVFGYLTATLATFFIGRDAEDDAGEIAGAKSIEALRAEIAALREEIQALRQDPPSDR